MKYMRFRANASTKNKTGNASDSDRAALTTSDQKSNGARRGDVLNQNTISE
jgi:hypothetical protein